MDACPRAPCRAILTPRARLSASSVKQLAARFVALISRPDRHRKEARLNAKGCDSIQEPSRGQVSYRRVERTPGNGDLRGYDVSLKAASATIGIEGSA
jgi:hypothetical protein